MRLNRLILGALYSGKLSTCGKYKIPVEGPSARDEAGDLIVFELEDQKTMEESEEGGTWGQRRDRIALAMGELTATEQDAIADFLNDKSHEETAQERGIEANTSRQRRARALAKLKKLVMLLDRLERHWDDAIRELTAIEQDAVADFLKGKTHEEIAQERDIPETTSYRQRRRVLKKLKRLLLDE